MASRDGEGVRQNGSGNRLGGAVVCPSGRAAWLNRRGSSDLEHPRRGGCHSPRVRSGLAVVAAQFNDCGVGALCNGFGTSADRDVPPLLGRNDANGGGRLVRADPGARADVESLSDRGPPCHGDFDRDAGEGVLADLLFRPRRRGPLPHREAEPSRRERHESGLCDARLFDPDPAHDGGLVRQEHSNRHRSRVIGVFRTGSGAVWQARIVRAEYPVLAFCGGTEFLFASDDGAARGRGCCRGGRLVCHATRQT